MSARQPWTETEDQILSGLIKKHGTGNWILISDKMEIKTNANPRTGKQCRQRWCNHLDPSICKKSWTIEQQKTMFQAHRKYGNKWAQIANELNNRSDSDVKNHFYAVIRKCLRRLSKMFGRKNSTQNIKNVKPTLLSKLLENKNDTMSRQSSQALFKFIMERQNFQINALQKKTRVILENLMDRIIELSSESYDDLSKQVQQKEETLDKYIRLKRLYKKNQNQSPQESLIHSLPEYKEQQNLLKRKRVLNLKQGKKILTITPQIIREQIDFEEMKKGIGQQLEALFSKNSSFKISMIDNSSFSQNIRCNNEIIDYKNRISSQASQFKESIQNQRFPFDEIFMLSDSSMGKRRSSSEMIDMKRMMSNNDKSSIYVTPRNPTPGYSENLFQNWNMPAKLTKQDLDAQTNKIKNRISRNIQ